MEKYQYIKAFISAASEYDKHSSETTTPILQRNLGAISATLDLSIFDPNTSVASVFYVTLYEFMNNLGFKSSLIWSAVDVLQTACKNTAARHALIHTYKFAPVLTKLLEGNLTSEKRIRALKLMQELTYGIKISWQEAHLPHLIKTLSQWVTQSSEEEVITLSLGVLVNLCYKNLPAVYVLMRSVNTKTFLQSVVKNRGQNMNIRVQCCKLLIILEPANSDILDSYILDVASVTFSNIIPTLKNEDTLLLRHIVDFFDDIRENDRFRTLLLSYQNYYEDVEKILKTLQDVSNSDCASYTMEFLYSLVKLKVKDLIQLYPSIVKSSMKWVPIESVGAKALAVIKTIVVESRQTKNNAEVLEELDLSVLTLLIKEADAEESHETSDTEKESNLTELMQLFQELIKIPVIRIKVVDVFSVAKMRVLMNEILDGCNDSGFLERPKHFLHDPSIDFYIHALALIADLANGNTNWLTLYTELLQKKKLQMIMAVAIYTRDKDVKQKVLSLTATVGFPEECVSAVARCMEELEPLLLVQEKVNIPKSHDNTVNGHSYETLPLFSMVQEGRIDAFIRKLEDAFEKNQLSEITTSAVMELYEYKMAAMRHAERAMQASLEAATSNATNLQHRLAQLISQSSHLHQVLFNTQQCLEGMQTEKFALMKKLQETEEKTKKTHVTQVQEISGLKKIILEKENQIIVCNNRICELEQENELIPKSLSKIQKLESEINQQNSKMKELTNKNQEFQKLLQKMQENMAKKEKIIEENQKDIAALNQEIQQLNQQCFNYQNSVSEKEKDVQKLSNELNNLSRMRDMIFELTAKKKDLAQ